MLGDDLEFCVDSEALAGAVQRRSLQPIAALRESPALEAAAEMQAVGAGCVHVGEAAERDVQRAAASLAVGGARFGARAAVHAPGDSAQDGERGHARL